MPWVLVFPRKFPDITSKCAVFLSTTLTIKQWLFTKNIRFSFTTMLRPRPRLRIESASHASLDLTCGRLQRKKITEEVSFMLEISDTLFSVMAADVYSTICFSLLTRKALGTSNYWKVSNNFTCLECLIWFGLWSMQHRRWPIDLALMERWCQYQPILIWLRKQPGWCWRLINIIVTELSGSSDMLLCVLASKIWLNQHQHWNSPHQTTPPRCSAETSCMHEEIIKKNDWEGGCLLKL